MMRTRLTRWWVQARYRAALQRLAAACLEARQGDRDLRPLVAQLRRAERQRFEAVCAVGFPMDCLQLLKDTVAAVRVIQTGMEAPCAMTGKRYCGCPDCQPWAWLHHGTI